MLKTRIGAVFERWTVLELDTTPHYKKSGENSNSTWWICKCECGTTRSVRQGNLVQGLTRSCGCLMREIAVEMGKKYGAINGPKSREHMRELGAKSAEWNKTHGLTLVKGYGQWTMIRQRCQNPKNKSYPDYGGRGIKLCERWQDVAAFIEDMKVLGPRPPGMTLDRIDNDGDYEPGNVRWATQRQQWENSRTGKQQLSHSK